MNSEIYEFKLQIPKNTIILPGNFYTNSLPEGFRLKSEVQDWCNEHLKQWNTRYISVKLNKRNFMIPVIEFENDDDYLVYFLKWI